MNKKGQSIENEIVGNPSSSQSLERKKKRQCPSELLRIRWPPSLISNLMIENNTFKREERLAKETDVQPGEFTQRIAGYARHQNPRPEGEVRFISMFASARLGRLPLQFLS